MKKNNLFWGVFFIVLAVVILLMAADVLAGDFILKMLATVLLGAVAIKSLFDLSYIGIFIPLALIASIHARFLGIEQITPFPLIISAAFLSVACSFLFGHASFKKYPSLNTGNIVNEDNGNVYIRSRFTGTVRYVNALDLKNVYIDTQFGGTEVYFDNAVIAGDSAQLTLSVRFGGVELYIPRSWQVINGADAKFGAIEVHGEPAAPEKKLVLTGSVYFGGVDIIYR